MELILMRVLDRKFPKSLMEIITSTLSKTEVEPQKVHARIMICIVSELSYRSTSRLSP